MRQEQLIDYQSAHQNIKTSVVSASGGVRLLLHSEGIRVRRIVGAARRGRSRRLLRDELLLVLLQRVAETLLERGALQLRLERQVLRALQHQVVQ